MRFKLSNRTKLIVKWLFILVLAIFIANKLQEEEVGLKYLVEILRTPLLVALLILLTLCNWYFDTIAWKRITKDHSEVKFYNALHTNLISQYLGILTPFGLGEYRAKMRLFKNKEERNQSVVNTLSYRWSKSVSKFGVGLLAATYLLILDKSEFGWWLVPAWVIYFFFVAKYKTLIKLALQSSKFDDKYGVSVEKVNIYPSVIPSALKFLSYAFQFAFILNFVFEIGFFEALLYGIVLYALTSFIPQASFLDPLIKGGIAAFLMPNLISAEAMLSTVFAIWIFNVGVPAIVGALLWFQPAKPKS